MPLQWSYGSSRRANTPEVPFLRAGQCRLVRAIAVAQCIGHALWWVTLGASATGTFWRDGTVTTGVSQ
jgi:hypothetical protein